MSATTKLEHPSDLTFDEYIRWQYNAISFENLSKQSIQLKATNKYVFDGINWSIPDYEGFAVISAVNVNPGNENCFNLLIKLKDNLKSRLQNETTYYWLPEESYHQTIANTLSNGRYNINIKEPGLIQQYPEIIKSAFDSISLPASSTPVDIKMLGFNVFGSCIALLGIFEDKYDYERIINFRKQFYSNPSLNKLGIKLTRPFIGHITFAYVCKELTDPLRERLAQTLNNFNNTIERMNIVFKISFTELRYFKNLSHFEMEPDYPSYNLITN